jgi:hypothetical protein
MGIELVAHDEDFVASHGRHGYPFSIFHQASPGEYGRFVNPPRYLAWSL